MLVLMAHQRNGLDHRAETNFCSKPSACFLHWVWCFTQVNSFKNVHSAFF